MNHTKLLLPSLTLLLTACGSSSDNTDADVFSAEVAPYEQACMGKFQRLCLGIRRDDEEHFKSSLEHIEGLTHEWGHHYTLTLRQVTLPEEEVMSDGSLFRLELVEVLSVLEDPVGTAYTVNNVFLEDRAFRAEDGEYTMLGQPFGCADTARCDELVAISDSGGMVNVTFEYQGNGEIALAAWE